MKIVIYFKDNIDQKYWMSEIHLEGNFQIHAIKLETIGVFSIRHIGKEHKIPEHLFYQTIYFGKWKINFLNNMLNLNKDNFNI